MMIISFFCFFVFVFLFSRIFIIYIFSIFNVSENDENASDMACGSDFEEVKNDEIPLPSPGILLMLVHKSWTCINL